MNTFLSAILLTASLVGAAPLTSTIPKGGHGFSVTQRAVNEGFRTHGAHSILKTYQKYGKTPPAHVIGAVKASTGTVVATPGDAYDGEYLCQVFVGGTQMLLDFDTGSSDFWVHSSLEPASNQTGHKIYTPSSSAKQLSGQTWAITYGDGSSAAGVVYNDAVTVGGFTYASQAVEAATSVSSQLVSSKSDGIVGLAFNPINQVTPTQQKTFLSNASPSLIQPIMVANLKYHSNSGSYDFGYINASRYTGSISYTSVASSSGYWQINVAGYGTPSPSVSSPFTAIVDTGTSLVYVPTPALTAYYSKVTGATNSPVYGGWTIPCSTVPPNFTLTIGSFTSTIPGKYIIYGPVAAGSSTCFGGLQDGTAIGLNILGDIWIKSQMVIFDNGASPRIGLATPATLP